VEAIERKAMGADIENPDGGDYIAAAAKEDADAMTSRKPSHLEMWCSGAFMSCYVLAMLLYGLYLEHESVKEDPARITIFVRVNLCFLLLLCFASILFFLGLQYRFRTGPFKKEEA
jgi:hypothetical protein